MTVTEVNYAQEHLPNGSDLLTWHHCCLNAKFMWRFLRLGNLENNEEKANIANCQAVGHAMMFLQTLWVIPKHWENLGILNVSGHDPTFKPTYASSERQAWSLIAEHYEKKDPLFRDPLHRHFEVNRILRQNKASAATPFNPHLLKRKD